MSFDDYVYEPDDTSKVQEYEEDEECFVTSLQELDEIEMDMRNQDETDITMAPDNRYPNVLNEPLFVKTMGPPRGETEKIETVNHIREPLVSTTPEEETIVENARLIQDRRDKSMKSMSIESFVSSLARSYLDIVNDLLTFRDLNDLKDIFTKDERLVAIGVLFLAISIFFIFFKTT